jgi:hypothetical protein
MMIPIPPAVQQTPAQQVTVRQSRARDRGRRAVSLDPGSGPLLPSLVPRNFPQLALPAFVPGQFPIHPGALFPGLQAPAPAAPVPVLALHAPVQPTLGQRGPSQAVPGQAAPGQQVLKVDSNAGGLQENEREFHGFAPTIHDSKAWKDGRPFSVPSTASSTFLRVPDDNGEHGFWRPVKKIGQGNFGTVHLWVRVEDDIVKEVSSTVLLVSYWSCH